MDVLAFDVRPDQDAAAALGFRYAGLQEVLASSDVVTLHVPGNEKTRHMISYEQFDRMKDGVVLINTSRGQVIHNRALVRALAEGKVAAAGLDVLPEEPVIREEAELLRSVYQREHNMENLLADHVLLRVRNVIVTPHSAFKTREAIQRILDTTVDNIRAFIDGEPSNAVAETHHDAPAG
jgi:D-lactate dehydrogenase